jgi:hypothetical protein
VQPPGCAESSHRAAAAGVGGQAVRKGRRARLFLGPLLYLTGMLSLLRRCVQRHAMPAGLRCRAPPADGNHWKS